MPDKKLPDAEIVKALECCNHIETDCELCPLYTTKECSKVMLDSTLDLINRIQAENERLKKAKYIFSTVDYCADDLDKVLKENEELKSAINGFRSYEDKIKAEAYKECIEKVENTILPQLTSSTLEKKEAYYFCLNVLDNLLKEMVGDNGES